MHRTRVGLVRQDNWKRWLYAFLGELKVEQEDYGGVGTHISDFCQKEAISTIIEDCISQFEDDLDLHDIADVCEDTLELLKSTYSDYDYVNYDVLISGDVIVLGFSYFKR